MDTGVWTVQPGFWTAVLNPLYLPQLFFRTPFALVTAGMFGAVPDVLSSRARQRLPRPRRPPDLRLDPGLRRRLAAGRRWPTGARIPERMFAQPARGHDDPGLPALPRPAALAGRPARWRPCVLVCVWGLDAGRAAADAGRRDPRACSRSGSSRYFERVREFIRKPDVIASLPVQQRPAHAGLPAATRRRGCCAHATYARARGSPRRTAARRRPRDVPPRLHAAATPRRHQRRRAEVHRCCTARSPGTPR